MTYRFRGKIVTYTVLFLLSLIVFFPMYWIVRSSLLNLQEILEFPPIWFPNAFRIDNYTEVMERVDFGKYFVNTFIVIIPVLVGVGLTASLTAFGFARLEFPLKNLWFSLIIMTILLPSIVTLVPTYIGWSKLQLTNTYWPLIIPAFFGGGAFNIFLLRQFLMTIPKELDESAVIDGAGYFTIYRKIILPLIKPAIVVVLLFTFVGVWNDFLGQLVYLNDANKYTVSLGLSTLRGANNTPMNLLMAGTAIMVIPAVIVFLFGQRYFIEGIATTGIKG
ncbi:MULTISPECIES: carbohydrate ABC transporter permease [unclassified Paenibacillus]|uniref:carbohydrate ABC transporter permease n=1 Tax=unclassified Paenibacillus TaxID=185978 RepID=UPI00070CD4BF|nr:MULTISPECIES: carbohydrate ABC transporter permease [unclassified Paenibacillus]KQX46547.1 sugar ABC transporter ATP-binding protein [Paenibacillus sp. Root444D2]KRE34002.1 sugar ABC transporter ATP-binding protein [Paenibacillus sp. Soil724D2]